MLILVGKHFLCSVEEKKQQLKAADFQPAGLLLHRPAAATSKVQKRESSTYKVALGLYFLFGFILYYSYFHSIEHFIYHFYMQASPGQTVFKFNFICEGS